MPKRKSTHPDGLDAPPRRSTRQRTSTSTSASASASASVAPSAAKSPKPKSKPNAKPTRADPESSKLAKTTTPATKARGGEEGNEPDQDEASNPAAPKGKTKSTGRAKAKATPGAAASLGDKTSTTDSTGTSTGTGSGSTERQYWLMKAEPETRFENGVDVSFSIDDLAAKTEPEPWDGIRNYVARNNLRAMKKGDLSFFWHSNCKEPGIVGVMEIVQEHTPDLSAHDSKSAYYDPKSSPSDPKWSVVHVEFRKKFAVPIKLKEMRELAALGRPLENMQMMKQSRLSVSRVSEAEWEFLMGEIEEKNRDAA